jgi:2-succinyl-6-hydroxy-2,4-cyclohexadiene-1-carboxylate synthase
MPLYDVNGIRLNVEVGGSGPPLVMLHGFTGSADAWQRALSGLQATFTTFAIEMIGHGRSDAPADPARYRIERAVDDVVGLLDQLGLRTSSLLGYSMGGRVAQHLALASPDRFDALVLESAAPGIADPAQRAERARADEKLARLIEERGVDHFVTVWERVPLFASQQALPPAVRDTQREIRRSQRPHGLANSLRGMGAGAMMPVLDRLGEFRMPVLYVAGELDTKYVAIGRTMTSSMPNARLAVVPGAGHTVHLEKPDEFVSEVLSSLYLLEASRQTPTV